METNFIIVLNDNNMSISENVGGMSRYLSGLRTATAYTELKEGIYNSLNSIPVYGEKMVNGIRRTKNSLKQFVIPGMLFENMGITYLGPVDGHDIRQLLRVFQEAKRVKRAGACPCTDKKGQGLCPRRAASVPVSRSGALRGGDGTAFQPEGQGRLYRYLFHGHAENG